MKKHTLPSTLSLKAITLIWVLLSLLLPATTMAQSNEWWFEIEVILFKRKVEPENLAETFKPGLRKFDFSHAVDLLTPYIQPDISYLRDGLPLCQDKTTTQVHQAPAIEYIFPDLATPQQDPPETSTTGGEAKDLQTVSMLSTVVGETNPVAFKLNSKLIIAKDTQPPVLFDRPQIPDQIACVYSEEQQLLVNPFAHNRQQQRFIKNVPVLIDALERLHGQTPYLIAADSLQLKYLYKEIKKQRDLSPLLHLGWRQEIKFGRNQAPFYRLFAGQNFANEYAQSGDKLWQKSAQTDAPDATEKPHSSTDDSENQQQLYADIRAALADDSPVPLALPQLNTEQDKQTEQVKLSQLWELDGLFKVYLQNINRVPYLHIDTELEYRAPVHLPHKQAIDNPPKDQATSSTTELSGNDEKNVLQPYNLNQLRRVISKEIHYFDHPLFGMLVQIRRHKRPEPQQQNPAAEEQSN